MKRSNIIKRIIISLIIFGVIPLVVFLGVKLFEDRNYKVISILVAILSCIPFFIRFEKSNVSAREIIVIAVMSAFSIIGRLIFAPIPAFKPVTAITIIAGIALGAESGFIVGSMTAVVSNMFYGQGPWTPFQMFVWGIIGYISGLLFKDSNNVNKIKLYILGGFGGIIFSLLMDIWTTVSLDGEFILSRYLVNVFSSLSFMAIYAVSNIIFLVLLAKPFLEKLNRIKIKYNLFTNK